MWIQSEPGPICTCGWPTFVNVTEKEIALICIGHSYEAGAAFPLPKNKPEKWPDLTNDEMQKLVEEGMKEQDNGTGS